MFSYTMLIKKVKMVRYLTHVCLFLLFFARPSFEAKVDATNSLASDGEAKNIVNLFKTNVDSAYNNQSEIVGVKLNKLEGNEARALPDTSVDPRAGWLKLGWQFLVGRTFGRPFKKLAAALIPLSFQLGAASTWAVVAALVGVKTLVIALVILKLLLVAGAAKIGALFGAAKSQHHGGWEPPQQKEIHLHIHNGGHSSAHEEHIPIWYAKPEEPLPQQSNNWATPYSKASPSQRSFTKPFIKTSWSRDGTDPVSPSDTKDINLVINPYAGNGGPQTISTPYGNYVRVDSPQTQNFDMSALHASLAA